VRCLSLRLIGDTLGLVSLWLTTRADRIGRRRVLKIGSVLMAAAGLAFAATGNLLLLIIAGTSGVISPSGNEVGPFLPEPLVLRCSAVRRILVCSASAYKLAVLYCGNANDRLRPIALSELQSDPSS
jgi:MFS family permease